MNKLMSGLICMRRYSVSEAALPTDLRFVLPGGSEPCMKHLSALSFVASAIVSYLLGP